MAREETLRSRPAIRGTVGRTMNMRNKSSQTARSQTDRGSIKVVHISCERSQIGQKHFTLYFLLEHSHRLVHGYNRLNRLKTLAVLLYTSQVQMHDIGSFVDIQYADISHLIRLITDTDIYVYFSPHLTSETIKSLIVEFTYSTITHTLTRWQMQA